MGMSDAWRTLTILAVVVALLGLLTACGGDEQPAPGSSPTSMPTAPPDVQEGLDGEALLEERCVDCHTLTRVHAARHDESQWQTSVQRMISYGTELSEGEQEVLIAYLTENYGP
jgi:hypothetical protein